MSALAAWIVGVLTKDVLSFFMNLLMNLWKSYKARQDVAKQAQADADKLQNAKTAKEKEDAANQINHDTFGGSSN